MEMRLGGSKRAREDDFLKLLMGQYEYSGSIDAMVSFDYFPFEVPDTRQTSLEVLSQICPLAQEWEILKELSALEVKEEALWMPFENLSQGEQTKLLLAGMFLKPQNFLLLDEPTNHLDAQAREVLTRYLQRKSGFLLVSHDRMVLDGCVDHILAINRQSIDINGGNYSDWLERFSKRQEWEKKQNDRLKKDIRRLQDSVRQSAAWSDHVEASKIGAADKGYVGHKAAKMMKRAKNMERRQQEIVSQKRKLLVNVETAEALKMTPLIHHAKTLVTFQSIAPMYDQKEICGPQSFSVRQGQRVFLTGNNGSGKSSLLKLIIDPSRSYTGTLELASQLKVSYVSQDTCNVKGSIHDYAYAYGIDDTQFRSLLRKMGFERNDFEKNLQDYSDGQKKKVMLARSLCEKAHLYVWDEPLNFIDIYTRTQIESMILESSPTMVLVEHDALFRKHVQTDLVVLK